MDMTLLIWLLLGLPLLAPITTLLCANYPNIRDAVSVLIGLVTGMAGFMLYRSIGAGEDTTLTLFQFAPNLALSFRPEPLGALFALVAGGLWPLASLYTVGYLRGAGEKNHTRFFAFYAIAIHAAMGIALADNLFTLFIFYEILTFSTYPLVTHKGTAEAKAAGRLYLGILVSTSIMFLLLGIIIIWAVGADLSFTSGGVLRDKIDPRYVPALVALFAFGIGKAALIPIHRWLPAAMVAPTPVSALLHAVAVVKAGVFTMLKVLIYIFGIEFLFETGASVWLVWLSCFTLLAASFVAMTKTNLKARLAYSTISQLSYVVLGGALASLLAAQGAALHILMHAAGKITLFFCAGAIYVAHHYSDLKDMDGLGRRMPITYVCFALGALSIMGIPPLGGTWSKFMLILGALDAGQIFVVFVLLVSSLLNLYYLGMPILRGFFAPAPAGMESGFAEAPWQMLVPLILTALLSLALFFLPAQFLLSFGGLS